MMFDFMAYGTEIALGIVWINLNYVMLAVPMREGSMKVYMTNGQEYVLHSNWKDRDDVARFKERMEGMK